MFKLYCRVFQIVMRIATYFLPWRKPQLLLGVNSIHRLPELIKDKDIGRVLIVTDRVLPSLGLMDGLISELNQLNIAYEVYDKTIPNPTIDNIEQALSLYKGNGCQAVIAFGGGSPIDCAKGVCARIAKPKKSITQLRGLLKIRKRTPLLFAGPTTSGTGSETTLAAVVTDSRTHEKYALNDLSLIPRYAVLDPALTLNLPPHITSTTGMDALTHAVEAFIGRSNTRETKAMSKKAIALIFDNLETAYNDGTSLEARENMQLASYYAGIAFTRAYVGSIHAIAHALGGLYSTPHGLANAVILPYVLQAYGTSVHKALSELADWVGLSSVDDSPAQKSEKFIGAVITMNQRMNIPAHIPEIEKKDFELIAKRAYREINPLYPVPKIFSKQELVGIISAVKG